MEVLFCFRAEENLLRMLNITQLLTVLGEHFYLVIVICIEVLAAVGIISVMLTKNIKNQKAGFSDTAPVYGIEKEFIDAMNRRCDEVCLVVRANDIMPVYNSGQFKDMFGVNVNDIRNDMALFNSCFDNDGISFDIWKKYADWDGINEWHEDMQLKNGEWVHLSVQPRKDSLYDLLSFHYVTDIRRKIEVYESKLDEAAEASQSKTTFLSRMSHEIRTPMNGIIGMLALAESKLEPDHPATQYLEKVDELSAHLIALINDILDMSRIEAGKVELEEKPFSLRKMGEKLYDMFSKELEQRNIKYSVEYEDMTVDYVIGDELRITQVIINFLSNAVKFTEKGEICVTFRQMMMSDNVADIMIRVHDTGIGMSSEFIGRIFRPFEQESMETQKRYGGTGLGMAISDHIVSLMGGEIVVESVPEKGSDFMVFLHLPVSYRQVDVSEDKAHDDKLDASYDKAFEGKRILLAEDNELNAVIAFEVLQSMGAAVEIAVNGSDAVKHFNNHDAGYYDFILMDVQMPVMDGRTAARTIRGLARTDAQDIPIFALSADAFIEDERLSIKSGMNGHYAKPIDFAELQRSIGAFLTER